MSNAISLATRTVGAIGWVVCLAMASSSASAATLTVTTTADTFDGVCDGDCSIRDALSVSNTGDVIQLPAGTFALNRTGPETENFDHGTVAVFDLDINYSVTIQGQGPGQTIIDATGVGDRVFDINFVFASVTFQDLKITGGNATGGGGIRVKGNLASIALVNCELSGCTAGGGISSVGNVTVTDSTISGNTGTGIYLTNDHAAFSRLKDLTVRRSTIDHNSGSGVHIFKADDLLIENSTISSNTLDGVFMQSVDASIKSTTIANNGSNGIEQLGFLSGGFPVAPNVTVQNTILAGNTAGNSLSSGDGAGPLNSNGYNLSSDGTAAGGFTQGSDLNSTDPLLEALALNAPGTTRTHAIPSDSPAIDNGNSTLTADQRGVSRPQGTFDDIGSFEGEPPPDDDGDGVPNAQDLCPDTPNGEPVDADGCGCQTEDAEDPTITCPNDVTVSTDPDLCTAAGVNLGAPTIDDNCPGATAANDAPATFDLGDATVTWTVTDASGNTATCEQTVTVEDNEDPTITCPADINVSADPGACEAAAVSLGGEPTSDDNCGVASVTNDIGSRSGTFPVGDTIVTWTVTDDSGNTATCDQTVTVTDDEDPTITCPADVSVSTDPGACTASGVNLGAPTTDDNCPGETATNDAPATFNLGDTTVTWTVTDASGNTATCEQTVTVTDDEDPTITCPANVTASADPGACIASGVNLGAPTTDDNCPGATAANDAPATFNLGDTTVTWTVTDASGNTATCAQTVTVTDDEDPTITTCPPDRTLTANANCQTTVPDLTGEAAADDNCSPPTVTQDPPAGTVVGLGVTDVTITATDDAGNTATCTVEITVTSEGCDEDADGIDGTVEDGAPNGGDGNNDGIPDSQQANVSSLPDINGNYATIAAPDGTTLESVGATGNPSPADAPAGVEFPAGFLDFNVTGVTPGGAVQVVITFNLPEGTTLDSYWKYGPTPDDPAPHWYEFAFDGTTGAEINDNVVTLHFVDGRRGDGDLTANGVIVDPGAAGSGGANPAPQPQPQEAPCHNVPLSLLFRFPICGFGCAASLIATLVMMAGIRVRIRRRATSRRLRRP